MRETGVVRQRLGLNDTAAKPYIGVARTQLGILKNFMALGGLQQLSKRITLSDGTDIVVASIFGQDVVQIEVPVGGVAGGVAGEREITKPQKTLIRSARAWLAASVTHNTGTPYDSARGGKYSVETVGSGKVAKPVVNGVVSTDPATWLNLATGVPAGFNPGMSGNINVSGTDVSQFTGGVRFKIAPDYAAPADANHDNVYELTLRGETETKNVSVGVKYFYGVSQQAQYELWALSAGQLDISDTDPTYVFVRYLDSTESASLDDPVTSSGTATGVLSTYSGAAVAAWNAYYHGSPPGPVDEVMLGESIVSNAILSHPTGYGVLSRAASWAFLQEWYSLGGYDPGNYIHQFTANAYIFRGRTFTQLPDAAQGITYTTDGTTERFTLITDQQIWPLTA